ncbi:hypothetical protein KIL84_016611 [Mauremys mutica]|uniref:Uncharacterized protein n=1 Tax=Mauremys mutica TaxID=74926 RepID=A0A9D3X4S3_9SAUR|nr:hypothetical protein KIL84_016611 [Mauremys mutica]
MASFSTQSGARTTPVWKTVSIPKSVLDSIHLGMNIPREVLSGSTTHESPGFLPMGWWLFRAVVRRPLCEQLRMPAPQAATASRESQSLLIPVSCVSGFSHQIKFGSQQMALLGLRFDTKTPNKFPTGAGLGKCHLPLKN